MKQKDYYTIVYSDHEYSRDPNGMQRVLHEEGQAVNPLDDLPVEGILVFNSREEAVEAARFHFEHWEIRCHAVKLGEEK